MLFEKKLLFLKNAVKSTAFLHGGVPGENIPFNFKNRLTFTLKVGLFFGIGFAIPFIAAGKSVLANYLADLNINLPEELIPTHGLRIVEYDLNNIEINGTNADIDVQIWDASGDDKYIPLWCVFRKNVDGIVFIYNQEDEVGVRKLDYMYNYFVSQPNRSLKACLVCSVQNKENNARLSSVFSKISQIVVNVENHGEKFKQDFSKYIVSVVNTITNK